MTRKEYTLNQETNKIELYFSKSEYQSLSQDQKKELQRYFIFSGTRSTWVSRSKHNHYFAIETAKKLGFVDGGKTGERITYAEELERKVERAKARVERYEQHSENAKKRAVSLQREFNRFRGDIAFMTQPIIAGHRGSQAFAKQRQKIVDRYTRGFDEYRKSEYFKGRASIAQATADMKQLKSLAYLDNRIKECKARIKAYERLLPQAEQQDQEWAERLLSSMEYETDKLAFFQNALEDLGGLQFNRDNMKPGYIVKIRGSKHQIIKVNPSPVQTRCLATKMVLNYPYAEI